MKRKGLLLLAMTAMLFGLFSFSWGQCPQDPRDHGICDTLFVEPWAADLLFESSPDFVRVPLFVYHDIPSENVDSIAGFVVPLCFTHTNPAKYCSTSPYNNTVSVTTLEPRRSIFRDLDGIENWMLDLQQENEDPPWDTRICNVARGDNWWLGLVPTGEPDRRYGEDGLVRLLATMTFKIQDTMHVCIDTCLWPPSSRLAFTRGDGIPYMPRHKLPICFWVGPSRIQVISPNGGEMWVVGETHDITWLSENFAGPNVKIEYSTNFGTTWIPIINTTPNTGSYPWLIPSTPSDSSLVKVSDAVDGDPYDVSDSAFAIIYTPYFTIDATPDTQWAKQGDTTSYEVILTSFYGFSSPCTLTIHGLPPQITHQFDPPIVTPTDTSTLALMIDSLTPLGSYALTIVGTEMSKQITDSVQVILYVISSLNRRPQVSVPGPQTVYGGLQIVFPVIATDPDTTDTLTLTKSGVGDFPCYPHVSPVVCYFQWITQPADTLNSPYTVIFAVDDGRDSTDTGVVEITVLPYDVLPSGMPGDVTGDTLIDAADVVFLINYLFKGGPPPNPPAAGDVNGDCFIGISDIIWLINYLYREGPPPQIRCLPGDFNYDGFVNMLDPPYFIDYMAFGGPPFVSMKSTDVNADCFINVVDLVYEIKYLLRGGVAPEPGCIEPIMGGAKPAPPSMAEVSFSKSGYDPVSRTNQIPVSANFDVPVAGVELVITFDPEVVSLLPPTLTGRTKYLGLFYNLGRGKLMVGLVDISGVNSIQPGDGPILNLNFVPKDSKTSVANSIQINKATFVDMQAQELLEKMVK